MTKMALDTRRTHDVLVSTSLVVLSILLLPPSLPSADARAVTAHLSENGTRSVEVLVVVDKEAYLQWQAMVPEGEEEAAEEGAGGQQQRSRHQRTLDAITQFVKSSFVSANIIWKGIEEFGVSIDLRIDSIRVVTDDVVVASSGSTRSGSKTVLNEEAFWSFFRWLIRNGMEFDHALLLTGLNLANPYGESGHEGYAYMNTMCTPESISIVENMVNGIPAVVIAHEIAHSFGARHDGDNNNCNSTSGFIMNANNIGTSPRHWNFSRCSGQAVVGKLQELRTGSFDCLAPGSTRSSPLQAPYLGLLYTGDQLCQKSEGNHSYVCRHLYGEPESPDSVRGARDICEVLWCLVNSTYCTGVAPVDGMPCGQGKRCLAGSCVPFDDVPQHVSDSCYTGDKPGLAWGNQTCSQVVGSFTHLCQDRWYQDFCCATCATYRTDREDCPFGDAHNQCNRYYCGTRWENQCCDTCRPAARAA